MVAMLDPPPPRVRASVGCANGGLRVIFILVVPEPFFLRLSTALQQSGMMSGQKPPEEGKPTP